jgi:hypothetical protein
VIGKNKRQPLPNDHVRAVEATSNHPISPKVLRRECYVASVHMKLIVSLFVCLSAERPSPAAAELRRRRQRPGHRPGLAKTYMKEYVSPLICQISCSCCGSVASPQETVLVPAWAPRSRATHARTLLPAAWASVPFKFVLVRARVSRSRTFANIYNGHRRRRPHRDCVPQS